MDINEIDIDEKELYDYLLKDCAGLTQQIEELLKENIDPPGKHKPLLPEHETNEYSQFNLKSETNEKIGENVEIEDSTDDYKKKKEALLNQKKYIEDQFLDINIDIQKKAKQLSDFEETIKRTKMEIGICDKGIKEKSEFIQFLEEQIRALTVRSNKK